MSSRLFRGQRLSEGLALLSMSLLALLLSGCGRGPARGPVKGVLVVLPPGSEDEVAAEIGASVQRYVDTTDREAVFDISFVDQGDFEGDFRLRRTILIVSSTELGFPEELSGRDGAIGYDYDVWARGQSVYAVSEEDLLGSGGTVVSQALADSLERAYERHMQDYVYGSFVSTQMSSPERLDSLGALGFTIDVPKSYETGSWLPDDGFVQFQRELSSESLLLMLSIRWTDYDGTPMEAGQAVIWREEMARRFFYDASQDSVDRSRVQFSPMAHLGLDGWMLLGVWRNPEHLNAGAFTSYILFDEGAGTKYVLDFEVFHPHASKEIYLREGWIIMNTFVPGGSDG